EFEARRVFDRVLEQHDRRRVCEQIAAAQELDRLALAPAVQQVMREPQRTAAMLRDAVGEARVDRAAPRGRHAFEQYRYEAVLVPHVAIAGECEHARRHELVERAERTAAIAA